MWCSNYFTFIFDLNCRVKFHGIINSIRSLNYFGWHIMRMRIAPPHAELEVTSLAWIWISRSRRLSIYTRCSHHDYILEIRDGSRVNFSICQNIAEISFDKVLRSHHAWKSHATHDYFVRVDRFYDRFLIGDFLHVRSRLFWLMIPIPILFIAPQVCVNTPPKTPNSKSRFFIFDSRLYS